MEAIQVIEEILSKVFKWHRFPVSLKAEAVLLYFKGLSLRAVREFLLHKGYKVSIETIREWFHAVGKALQAIYTIAIWVYVDETKIEARDRTYYLWLAVGEKGLPVFVHPSRRRDAWTRLANALRAYFFVGFLSFPTWDKNKYSTPHPVVKGKKLDVCLYKTTRSDTGFKDQNTSPR